MEADDGGRLCYLRARLQEKKLVVIRSKTNTTGTHTMCINGFCDTCSTWLHNTNPVIEEYGRFLSFSRSIHLFD